MTTQSETRTLAQASVIPVFLQRATRTAKAGLPTGKASKYGHLDHFRLMFDAGWLHICSDDNEQQTLAPVACQTEDTADVLVHAKTFADWIALIDSHGRVDLTLEETTITTTTRERGRYGGYVKDEKGAYIESTHTRTTLQLTVASGSCRATFNAMPGIDWRNAETMISPTDFANRPKLEIDAGAFKDLVRRLKEHASAPNERSAAATKYVHIAVGYGVCVFTSGHAYRATRQTFPLATDWRGEFLIDTLALDKARKAVQAAKLKKYDTVTLHLGRKALWVAWDDTLISLPHNDDLSATYPATVHDLARRHDSRAQVETDKKNLQRAVNQVAKHLSRAQRKKQHIRLSTRPTWHALHSPQANPDQAYRMTFVYDAGENGTIESDLNARVRGFASELVRADHLFSIVATFCNQDRVISFGKPGETLKVMSENNPQTLTDFTLIMPMLDPKSETVQN
jgi:hypothetical protein